MTPQKISAAYLIDLEDSGHHDLPFLRIGGNIAQHLLHNPWNDESADCCRKHDRNAVETVSNDRGKAEAVVLVETLGDSGESRPPD